MAIYDHTNNQLDFVNWPTAPHYIKTCLSNLMDDKVILAKGSRVKCLADVPLSLEESIFVKDTYIEQYQLREFSLEEVSELDETLTETESGLTAEELNAGSVDELVLKMINSIDSTEIDVDILSEQYSALKV